MRNKPDQSPDRAPEPPEKPEDQQVDRRGFLRKLVGGSAAVVATTLGISVGMKVYINSQKPPSLDDIREPERSNFLTKQTLDLVTELVRGNFALHPKASGLGPEGVRKHIREARSGLDDAPPIIDKAAVGRLMDELLEKQQGRDLIDHAYAWLPSLDLNRDGVVSTDEMKQVSSQGPTQRQLLPPPLEAFLARNWETARTLVAIARIVRKEPYAIPDVPEAEEAVGGGGLAEIMQNAMPKVPGKE